MGRTVLRYCGSMNEARAQISTCVSKYRAQCSDEDIVIDYGSKNQRPGEWF